MKTLLHTLVVILLFIVSCHRTEPLVEADLFLDDLEDKTNYNAAMVVDCRYFNGQRTTRLLVGQLEYELPEILELGSGYHHMEIFTEQHPDVPEVIRLVILDEERGEAEWGLPPWTPAGVAIGSLSGQQIRAVYPREIPAGFQLPLVVIIGGELTASIDNLEAAAGENSFLLKRGVGSAWIAPGVDQLLIDSRNIALEPGTITAAAGLLDGIIEQDTVLASGSYLHVPSDLYIADGVRLDIEEGVFLTLAPGVNIYNQGTISIAGSMDAPVTVTCSDMQDYWGGFISTGSRNRVEASHTIFARSGYHDGEDYKWGHAHRQALFYTNGGSLAVDNCYMIDHIGQVFYPLHASVEIAYCLIQRVKTGGQVNHSQLLVTHSVFTDFPDDSQQYRDEDNDGLYINDSDADISNSVFMYAKDDGLDSGASPGGEIRISNTRFESNFHEGAALSSDNDVVKTHHFTNCLFLDNGQGLELGFSSPNHQVYADSCQFLRNGIGIRFGDCYVWTHKGSMHISNSESLDNRFSDVWNMVREDWAADTARMDFDHVLVSRPNPMYPELLIQNADE